VAYLDVSVAHVTAPSANHVVGATSPDASLLAYWREKVRREYEPLPPRMAFRLLPVVASTYGSLHPETLRFFGECARRVGSANASVPGAATLPGVVLQSWLCRLSVALQRQNAAMARRCVPADGDFGLDKPWAEGPPLLWEQMFMACACEDACGDEDEDSAGEVDMES